MEHVSQRQGSPDYVKTRREPRRKKGESTHRRRPWQMLPSIAGTAPRSARQGGLGGGSAPSPPQHSASSWPSLSGGTELAPNPQLSNYQPWLDRGGRANSRSHGAALVLGCPGTHRRFQRGHVWRQRWEVVGERVGAVGVKRERGAAPGRAREADGAGARRNRGSGGREGEGR